MKLIQYFLPGKGKRVGLIQGDRVLDITSSEEGVHSTLDLVTQGKTAAGLASRATWLARRLHRRALDYRELQRPPSRRVPHLLMPIDPPEVWGAVGTYGEKVVRSEPIAPPDVPSAEGGACQGRRPVFFFKGTAARSVGPNAPVAIRHDSHLTVPEASLATVLGTTGGVVAFTACTDLTARDIEQADPGFVSQSKVYHGNCALGPCLVTPDELGDPGALQIRCNVLRAEETVFTEAVNTARLQWSVEELVAWLCLDNPVPPGTVLSTGTGIRVPDAMALRAGDRVSVEVQGIGRLSNPICGGPASHA